MSDIQAKIERNTYACLIFSKGKKEKKKEKKTQTYIYKTLKFRVQDFYSSPKI